MTPAVAALVSEIRTLQATGMADADIPEAIVVRELHARGWLITRIARTLRKPTEHIVGLTMAQKLPTTDSIHGVTT